ncbi:sushi, von Willebrand factor type A, EGF and pentraxin domain-containing protein 1 [Trichonephila inaurata madagascariensis]|uniref:Sushi, von Willebrand factor type A, EGF and pentraxin domain-containing protein 1 n=1 Tax=Trichonephila inaurata madagascariensis TaxID=2747483 RepID=A0A8X6YP02_9ARAC|nr:sushi, von Willebrand factor type A, EGF and pentraxin domain-containing protein 1 [Trichonephila inaurata madagascariensis]
MLPQFYATKQRYNCFISEKTGVCPPGRYNDFSKVFVPVLSATCHSFTLPKGVSIVGPCTYQNSDVCNAQCVSNGQVLWKEEAKCLSGGQWSPLPPCHTANSLELIRCDKLTDITEENMAACVKIKINVRGSTSTPKAICPEILQLFVKFGNCSADLGTNCTVSCPFGGFVLQCVTNRHEICTLPVTSLCPELKSVKLINCSRVVGSFCKVRCPNGIIAAEEIMCLPTNEWSPLPLCNYRSQCARQQLPAQVRFINTKCKQSTAPRCKVGCNVRAASRASNFSIRGLLFVKDAECKSSGLWHGLPNCEEAKKIFSKKFGEKLECPKPKLPKNSVLVSKCSPAEGSVCHYKCKEGFFSTGNNTIRCFMKRWIRESICKPILCPPLPKTFHHDITCRRTIGSNCDLQCKDGTLDGNSTVTCYVSGKWSTFPTCSSSFKNCTRTISPYISFVQDCSFQDDAKCQIRCPENFALVGRNFIKCEKGTWKNIPQCIREKISPYKLFKIKCSFPPPLHANLKLIGSCNPEGGITCDITCRDDSAYMTGPNSTTCLPPGIWSKIKPCSGKSYCSVPKFRKHLKVSQNCSGKEVGSKCYVKCKYRSEIGKFILCKKNLKWSSPPRCTCPLPILREDIDFRENCIDRNPEEKCALECKKGLLMIGDGNIRCKYKLKWTSLPSCKRPKCLKPKLSRVLSFKEDCTSKLSGERCKLECKEGGKMLKHSTIQCISGTHWTEQPKCACPFPFLSNGVIAKNDCRKVFPGQKCFLMCKSNSFKISRDFITCNSYTRWSGTSDCKRKRCPRPVLTNTLLFEEDCSVKGFGDRCHVSCKELGKKCLLQCKEGGEFFGPNFIVCLFGFLWTPLPTCSCPIPNLPDDLIAIENCNKKGIGQKCHLKCKEYMPLAADKFIICQNNTRWSHVPKCKKFTCLELRLPKHLGFKGDCVSKYPGEYCQIMCKAGGTIIGSHRVTCIKGKKWTKLPDCTCPSPKLRNQSF